MFKEYKKIIFHLPYTPNRMHGSSSNIRPPIMLKEFKKLGYDVFEIIGNAKERASKFIELKRKIKKGEKFDFMYSESSTVPNIFANNHHDIFYPFLEFRIFKFCNNNNIKIGLFYRDIHWRFNLKFKKQNGLKRIVINRLYPFFHKVDLRLYKLFLNVLYLPSVEMKKYIPELKNLTTHPLPPGLYEKKISIKPNEQIRITYVGGLSKIYDVKKILKTIALFPKEKISFTLCTREGDFKNVYDEYAELINNQNVSVVHLSGEDLDELYSKTDICCLFLKPENYHKFMMPVKLFEYISYRKPILSVQNTLFGDFVNEKNIGWSINYNDDSLKELISKIIYDDELKKNSFDENLSLVIEESSWKKRVEFIVRTINDNKNYK